MVTTIQVSEELKEQLSRRKQSHNHETFSKTRTTNRNKS